jgi:phage/plasmid-like protein (TIGR03299 family)
MKEFNMSHEVESMAYAFDADSNDSSYQTPWHGLGETCTPGTSVQEMLKKANLDWRLVRHPNFVDINGERIYTGTDSLVRDSDNKIIMSAPDSWKDVHNEDFFEFFHEYCEEGSMEINVMGSLNEGETVFGLARINGSEFSLYRGKDIVQPYMLITNYHKYGKSLDFRTVMTRVVCANTIAIAMKEEQNDLFVKWSHRKDFNPAQVKEHLGIAQSHLQSYKEAAEYLSTKNYKMDELIKYYQEIFPATGKKTKKLSKKAQMCHDVLHSQPGTELGEGTWWQALNSVTYAADHLFARTQNNRLNSAWYGSAKKAKNTAMVKALEYASAA